MQVITNMNLAVVGFFEPYFRTRLQHGANYGRCVFARLQFPAIHSKHVYCMYMMT